MGAGIRASHRAGESFLISRNISTITTATVMKGNQAVAPDFIRMDGANGQPGYTIYFNWSTTGSGWKSATDEQRERDLEIYRKGIKKYSGLSNTYKNHAESARVKAEQAAIQAGKTPAQATAEGRDAYNAYLTSKFIRDMQKSGASGMTIKSKGKSIRVK